jgi:DNA polymerase III epsilon subunit-like protein
MAFVIVLDTETTNTLEEPIAYDIGWAVVDLETEEVVKTESYAVAEVFLDKEWMAAAYFAEKVPSYWEEIKSGKRELRKLSTIYKTMREDFRHFGIKEVFAHNARFDYRSTNLTQRFISGSKYRFFFPFGTKICDTLKMSRELLADDVNYCDYCRKHGFVTKNNKPQFTAEVLYRYIHKDETFIESHTALEDVLIEKDILHYCVSNAENLTMGLWE